MKPPFAHLFSTLSLHSLRAISAPLRSALLYSALLLCALSAGVSPLSAHNTLDCSGASSLALSTDTQGSLPATGVSKGNKYNNDGYFACPAPEVVYKLNWPGGKLVVNFTPANENMALFVLDACGAADYVQGWYGSITNQGIELSAGTYYVVVDGKTGASGSYSLKVEQEFHYGDDVLMLKGDKLVRTQPTAKDVATGVQGVTRVYGYYTGTQQNPVPKRTWALSVDKANGKPQRYEGGKLVGDFVKQWFDCAGKKMTLYGTQVYVNAKKSLEGTDVLRCENGFTVAHQLDGSLLLCQGNNWTPIEQIITAGAKTYYRDGALKVYELSSPLATGKEIGRGVKHMRENDNQLVVLVSSGLYMRWESNQWSRLSPQYLSVSPAIHDPGIWSFVQPKSLLDATNANNKAKDLAEYKKGLTVVPNGGSYSLAVRLIPATGNCDAFLWGTILVGNKYVLINKLTSKTYQLPNGTAGPVASVVPADKKKYGTVAYRLELDASQTLGYNLADVEVRPSTDQSTATVWVFQFGQLARNYFLQLPNAANINKYLLAGAPKSETDAVQGAQSNIDQHYDKYLRGDNKVNYLGTKTSSDWALINYYFVQNNVMNAVRGPKPAYGNVPINDLSSINNRSLLMVGENDLNANISKQYFSSWSDFNWNAQYRGGAAFGSPYVQGMVTSEELTGKLGIINRPLDDGLRWFDHGIHEFGHGLVQLGNWTAIARKVTAEAYGKTFEELTTSQKNSACWDLYNDKAQRNNNSPECMCYLMQYRFNSANGELLYPGDVYAKKQGGQKLKIANAIFDENNTWMPPLILREGGYLPSGHETSSTPSPGFNGNAYYRLTNKWQGEGRSLDIVNDGKNNQPVLAKTAGYTGQYWRITEFGPGTYALTTKWQGIDKKLDCIQGDNQNRPVLNETENSGGAWKIIPVGNGYYRITNMWLNDRSLDVINDGTNNKIQLAKTGNYTGQYWKITEIK